MPTPEYPAYRSEAGATSSEYLIVAGLVVAILIGLGSTFRRQLMAGIQTVTCNIVSAVSGEGGGCGAGAGQGATTQGELKPSQLSQTEEASQRRQELFDGVRTELASMSGGYAVVAGGGGRLWRLWPDGRAEQLSEAWKATYPNLQRGEVLYNTHDGMVKSTVDAGPDPSAGIGRYLAASSEHSSIRGSINGGGDFI